MGAAPRTERLGRALIAPRAALAAAAAPGDEGLAAGDAVALILAAGLAMAGPALVVTAQGGDVRGGLGWVLTAMGKAATVPLIAAAAASAALWIAGRRASGGGGPLERAIDLAGVAMVPLIAVRLLGALALRVVLGPIGALESTPGWLPVALDGVGCAAAVGWVALAVPIARGVAGGPRAPARRARVIGRGLVGLMVTVLAVDVVAMATAPDIYRPAREGRAAPALRLPRIEGGRLGEVVDLAGLRGRVVVLDFWATWCGPCRVTMPLLERAARKHDDVRFLSINVEGEGRAVEAEAMVKALAPSMTLLSDDGTVAGRFGALRLPFVVVVGADGVVVEVASGFGGERDFSDRLDAAVERQRVRSP